MLLPVAGGSGTVVSLGELMMILELHRQGLTVSAIARPLAGNFLGFSGVRLIRRTEQTPPCPRAGSGFPHHAIIIFRRGNGCADLSRLVGSAIEDRWRGRTPPVGSWGGPPVNAGLATGAITSKSC